MSNPNLKTTDELPVSTYLRGDDFCIVATRDATRNSFNYDAKTSDGTIVEIKEFYLRDLCIRQGKEIVPRSSADKKIVKRLNSSFVQNAIFLTSLESDNVANVREVFEENGTAYMVSDKCEGTLLSELLAKSKTPFSTKEIVKIGNDLARALVEIHGFGMLHRDITPQNIIIQKDKTAVLLPDFGTFREDRSKASRIVSSVLQSTQDYAPYELAFDDSRQGDGSDIYSMAAVLYHLITGAPPAASLDRIAAAGSGEADPYVKLEGNVKGFDERFLRVVDFALELFLESRISSASEFTLISAKDADASDIYEVKRDVRKRSAPVLDQGLFSKVRKLFFRN